MAMTSNDSRPVTALIGDLARDVLELFRKEILLARAEAGEKAGQVLTAIGTILTGTVLLIGALIVLLQALVIALAELGLPPGWAALAVGIVVAVLAYGFVRKGMSDLQAGSLAPERTMAAMRRDAQTVKEQMR
jgi:hypothetical protein